MQDDPSRATSPGHILVVDDEPDNLRLIGPMLAGEGYQVRVAESGEQALAAIASMAGEIALDLVLLDILMPNGIDGVETCRRIKARPDMGCVPVVFLTGRDDHDTIIGAFAAGGADYVLRPFDPNVLLARVRAHATLGRLSRGLESALAERTTELRETNDRLRRLANEVSLVEERERRRLAGELHDSPMQKLSLAQMLIQTASSDPDAESDHRLASGLDLMREAMKELRTLQFEMSPPVLYQLGLGEALRWLADSTSRRVGIALGFRQTHPLPELGTTLAVLLFQCVRELVYNLVKHAGASEGWIEPEQRDGIVRILVTDNGRGCATDPPATGNPVRGGYGLFGVRERLRLIGGELRLVSESSGTRATIEVPVPVAAADREDRP